MQSAANYVNRTHHSTRPSHQRHRSASDPFLDPIYTPPYRPDSHPRSAPLPPPKQQTRTLRRSTDNRNPAMLEAAVRDTVSVRPVDPPSRSKMGRSQTGGVQTTASGSRTSPASSRRSYSQDSVTQAANLVEKSRRAGKPKKGSSHADVIDRLDFTGVGPMFHHDGPFDACMPSRNRQKSKAPMLAWSAPQDERDDPVPAAQIRATDRRLATVDNLGGAHYDSPYAIANAGYQAPELAYQPQKKQVDRIAEAWGIHEPEPYEEFFGGGGGRPNGETGPASAASSLYGGTEGRSRRSNRDGHEKYREQPDDGRPQLVKRNTRTNLPPPQPIFGSGNAQPAYDNTVSTSPPLAGVVSPGTPKRSKSLMQKFRKMRDAPNIPVDSADAEEDGSPPSSIENYASNTAADVRSGRPTHRHQNSFFGRFGRNHSLGGTGPRNDFSPPLDLSEKYVYVEDPKGKTSNKALPPRPADTAHETPRDADKDGYFDPPLSPGGTPIGPGAGLSRKTSLLKKVKGVVRGAGNK